MEIKIFHLIDGAKKAEGLTVIIDVFRAFSVACYTFSKGVKRHIPVGEVEFARKLKVENNDYILVGERNGITLPGFDFGNSPSQIIEADLSDRTVVHTTTAGTQGIVNANGAEEIITGSFVNASAIVRYIKERNPKIVSLVCMGYAYEDEAEEDTLCAEYIKSALEGKILDPNEIKERLRQDAGKRFFQPESQEWAPESDFDLCLDFNKFNFILKAEKDNDGLFYLTKIDI